MRDIMIAKNVKAIIGDGYRMDKGDSELKHERWVAFQPRNANTHASELIGQARDMINSSVTFGPRLFPFAPFTPPTFARSFSSASSNFVICASSPSIARRIMTHGCSTNKSKHRASNASCSPTTIRFSQNLYPSEGSCGLLSIYLSEISSVSEAHLTVLHRSPLYPPVRRLWLLILVQTHVNKVSDFQLVLL